MSSFIDPADIRARFSSVMSDMYRAEVPLYGDLLELVADINQQALATSPALAAQLTQTGELSRLNLERHGAIRLGKPEELATMRRLFAVMGMYPVGYYDLAPAGVPVHSTAFRALDDSALNQSPFRVFTSLLRLDLITDTALREKAQHILDQRDIFTARARELVDLCEQQGGLNNTEAEEFVQEAIETFRWHDSATVSRDIYNALLQQHRLIADVVAFRGPHINHLTPRTLDIDAVQDGMAARQITPKAIIEGPPPRQCPILLRQTSFKALNEAVTFSADNDQQQGHHTARFGEIEQRGIALTDKGHKLYDRLLTKARAVTGGAPDESNAAIYREALADAFKDFPDNYADLLKNELAYFHYYATDKTPPADLDLNNIDTLPALIAAGCIQIEPMVYEDFLPVSAAGIFQSNLGDDQQKEYQGNSNQTLFEQHLGSAVTELTDWYEEMQKCSIDTCLKALHQSKTKES